MQTLTIPASISKRKQACSSCRQRKKKCDAVHPVCSLCQKLGSKCDYTVQPGTSQPAIQPQLPTSFAPVQANLNPTMSYGDPEPNFLQFPGLAPGFFGSPPIDPSLETMSYPTPDSPSDLLSGSNSLGPLTEFTLPEMPLLLELVSLFFEHDYHMFPCFHKANFLAQIHSSHLQQEAPIVLYAMCCVAARHHSNPAVRERHKDWYEQARFAYELTQRFPQHGLRVIQAAILLTVHAFTIGDFSVSWLFIGKCWRQAVALGMNRMDAGAASNSDPVGDEKVFDLEMSRGRNVVEREEYRRTLWLLFIIDRQHAWPTGWPNAITEGQFKVDMPLADTLFQALDPEQQTSPHINTPFTRNLKRLISMLDTAKDPINLFQFIAVAHVLLGRISELVHSLHSEPNTPEFAEESEELDSLLVKFRLSLPRSISSLAEAQPENYGQVAWLNIILNTMAILLHYRTAQGAADPSASADFALAVASAQRTAQIVKDAARISIDILMSAHVGGSLYVAATVLLIQSRMADDDRYMDEIDMFKLVFERMSEVFVFLGLKFSIAFGHDFKRDQDSIIDLRERGFRGLLADCSKWSHVRDEVIRRGLPFDIT